MNNTRNFKPVLVGILILAALIALQAFRAASPGQPRTQASAGMGDVHAAEAQALIPVSGEPGAGQRYAGMGDLQRFEAQFFAAGSGSRVSYRGSAGMGDLHLFEASQ